jgi:hypothetical protein
MDSEKETHFAPTAIESWRNVVWAVSVLSNASSSSDYLAEVVRCNAALSMLVTGVETYAKTRFVELELEGVKLAARPCFKDFWSAFERSEELFEKISAGASANTKSWAATIADRVNFQSFEQLKKAYRKGYGIRFADLSLPGVTIEFAHKLMKHRHRVVHVSPLLGMVRGELEEGHPMFVNDKLLKRSIAAFDELISALHTCTLKL